MSSITVDPLMPLPIPGGTPPPLPKRGRPIIAWIVIFLAVVVAAGYEFAAKHWSAQLALKVRVHNEHAYLSELQVQGRELVGMVREFGQAPQVVEPQIKEGLKHGPYEERLRYVTLVGEIQGPNAALKQLATMRDTDWEQREPTAAEAQLTELLEKLYRIQLRRAAALAVAGTLVEMAMKEAQEMEARRDSAWSLNEAERRELLKKLDWYGELALAPADGPDSGARAAVLAAARKTTLTLLSVAAAVFLMGTLGFLLLMVGIGLLLLRLVRFRFWCSSRDGSIYAETFALWMVVYMALEVGAMFIPAGSWHMLLAGVFGLLSLLTLGWPVLRGISWRRVRQDLGWWTPGPAILEMAWGLGSYLASMPLLIAAVMVSAGMLSLYKRFAANDPFGIPPQATHPVQEILAHGSWWECAQVFLVAAVCAPIIEETMFRGVLYRHLREVGEKWSRFVSVLFSVVAASFVFAVIHPQGILGVPMLMALATGFALTRELRGSLIGSMTAHGINNALVTLVAISMS